MIPAAFKLQILIIRAIIRCMELLALAKDYLIWHYGKGVSDLAGIWRDFLWFGYRFFSLGALAKTLFAPLARIRTGYAGITDISATLQSITANAISRAVGFVLRIFVITAGAITEILLAALAASALALWLILPFLVIALAAFGAGVFP